MNYFLHHQVQKCVLRLFEDLASPVSLKASLLMRHGEWDQLSQMRVDPGHYTDAESYWRDATAASLLRKLRELPTTADREGRATQTFFDCEAECLRTNRLLYPLLFITPDDTKGVPGYINRVRKIIAGILGPFPDVVDGKFGPGSTYGDRGRFTTIPDKMSSKPTLTSEAWPYHIPWSGTAWAKACAVSGREVSFVRGNRFTTVPKDAEKDRGIAIEPSLNVFYQLAYGKRIRARLKDAGVNLQYGQDIHRRVACEASKRGHLSTIDLSNASDTISRNLVKLLLPRRWFQALDDLRSKRTQVNGKWYLLEKFSSMGNGFTFELETLIFLGLILGLSTDSGQKLEPGRNVFVFGDDIIVPSSLSKDVLAALSFFGMKPNVKKTFTDGLFRESCGGDYFDGVDVRPHFIEVSPYEPHQLISLANGLRRLAKGAPDRMAIVLPAWLRVLDALPSHIRNLRGPEGLGDLCVHDNESHWRPRWRSSIRYFRVYRPARFRKVSWQNFGPDVTLAAALYGVPWNNGSITPRDSVVGYKVGWVPHS